MRYFIINTLLIAALFYSNAIFAQPEEVTAPPEDDGWIEEYNDAFTIRLTLQRPWQFVLLKYRGSDSSAAKDISYQPNTMSNQGIEISYMNFILSYSRIVINSGEDESKYGSTDYSDYQLHYYSRNIGADLYLQMYDGFYLDEPGDFGLNAGDSGTIRQDLETFLLGFNFFYIFADNYSYSAAFKQTERQKKSAGGIIAALSMTYLSLSSGSTLIPASEQTNYGLESAYSGGKYTTVGISGGYAYTLVLGKIFFLTASAFGGIGVANMNYADTSGDVNNYTPFLKFNGRFAGGINHDNIFAGVAFTMDKTIITYMFRNDEGIAINADIINLNIFLGTRFDI
ncbi:MAG: DUF4421 domain-containing protein [bacterium]|nr:DUF4421 domain-containing protein [bacterium]